MVKLTYDWRNRSEVALIQWVFWVFTFFLLWQLPAETGGQALKTHITGTEMTLPSDYRLKIVKNLKGGKYRGKQ